MSNTFWFQDISILYDKNEFMKFLPHKTYSFVENLNAIVRFFIYYCISCYILNKDYSIFALLLVIMLLSIFVYNNCNKNLIENYDTHINTIRSSTVNNPVINLNQLDYNNGERGSAYIKDPNINKNIVNKTPMDETDTKAFERTFYTMPNSRIPNDQKAFAEWLYNTDKTCKEGNAQACVDTMPYTHTYEYRTLHFNKN